MSGVGDKNAPNIQVDRATQESDPAMNDRLKRRQSRLKNQITDVLGGNGPKNSNNVPPIGNRGTMSSSRNRMYGGAKKSDRILGQ
jgi:hypothetical protein